MPEVLLIGASGLAREVASAMADSHWNVVGILDDDASLHGSQISGVDVIGGLNMTSERDELLLICLGSGSSRRKVVDRLAVAGVSVDRYATFIDATARIPSTVTMGPGSIVLAGCVLTADLSVGRHVVLMPLVVLTHDDIVEDFVTIAAGVSVGGYAVLAEESYLGMNCSVRQRITVGKAAVVGMGSVVVKDVPAGETWVGIPARRLVNRDRN